MSANSYTSDLRDIRFVLHEQLRLIDTLTSQTPHQDVDEFLVDSLLDEAYKLSREVFFPCNREADEIGCTLQTDGSIQTPPSFGDAWRHVVEGGWIGMTAPSEYGGMGLPHVIGVATGEVMTGASMAFAMFPGLARASSNLLAASFTHPLRDLVCTKLYSGEWSGTMCLTEPGAGSDVGASRTRAVPTDVAGEYHITGEKIFITCGDHDLVDNIMHLVLARTPDAPQGTRGLSIFLVPKFDFDASGQLQHRNDVRVGKIEHKMGIHGSPTCAMVFGADSPAKGYLIGEEGAGMKIMFHMMNEARLEVGVQGLCGAAAAYQHALHYAKERVQGRDLTSPGDPDAGPVCIVAHPDVRRMLMWQRVHVETLRSMIYRTALQIDLLAHVDDPQQRRELQGSIDLMTPIIKSYGSDRGFQSAVLGLQTFGGYGYTKEYPVEQLVRDTKIASIYEGTNGIQALDLVGRKMQKGGGILFMNWMTEVTGLIEGAAAHASLADVCPRLEQARDQLAASAMHLGQIGMGGEISAALLQASPFLNQFGCVILAVEALRQATVAAEQLGAADISEQDRAFYQGKVLNLRFYVHNVLPEANAIGEGIRRDDRSCMDPILFA